MQFAPFPVKVRVPSPRRFSSGGRSFCKAFLLAAASSRTKSQMPVERVICPSPIRAHYLQPPAKESVEKTVKHTLRFANPLFGDSLKLLSCPASISCCFPVEPHPPCGSMTFAEALSFIPPQLKRRIYNAYSAAIKSPAESGLRFGGVNRYVLQGRRSFVMAVGMGRRLNSSAVTPRRFSVSGSTSAVKRNAVICQTLCVNT